MSGHLGGAWNTFGMLASEHQRSASLSSSGYGALGSQSSGLDVWVPEELRPAHSSLPHEGFSARNHDWNMVQRTIISVFQGEKLIPSHFHLVKDKISDLQKSEIGPFIYDYYKNQLVSKGIQILRENLNKDSEEDLVQSLSATWDDFYMEMLPTIQYILQEIPVKDLGVKEVTLLGFRDNLLLKLHSDGVVSLSEDMSPQIRQMVLVLQSVREYSPPSEGYLRLERLVAAVVSPYLGYSGLWEAGGPEPLIPSNRLKIAHISGGGAGRHHRNKSDCTGKRLETFTATGGGSLGRSTMMSPKRQASSPGSSALAPVAEISTPQFLQIDDSDYPRRHSATIL